jgi:choice-of-anchor B domain-containing protein
MKQSPSKNRLGLLVLILAAAFLIISSFRQTGVYAQDGDPPVINDDGLLTPAMQAFLDGRQPAAPSVPLADTPCENGMAGIYPCANIDLLAFMPLAEIGGGEGNDIWGWTDPLDGTEYAIMGRSSGTAFVDISNPTSPVYLGNLPTHTFNSSWRDIKVYANYAFIVSEASGHGMQVFDLTELRTVISPPVTFSETTHYSDFGSAHNLVINEDSGYAYAVGTSTCSGGLHMVDIQNPLSPTNAGCFSSDGYTHDAQCVNYIGPDPDHTGAEICFNANEDTLTVVDVTNKAAPVLLSSPGYIPVGYIHQGWLTDDQTYFLQDDELDELNQGHNTRTRVWDVSDLDAPVLIGFDDGSTTAIDHNQYIHDGYTYQANYRSGLRILNLDNIASADLSEDAYFDIYPSDDFPNFNGAWSVYPYFDSGVVVVSGIDEGLFVLLPQIGNLPDVELNPSSQAHAGEPGAVVTHTFSLTNTGNITDSFNLAYSGWSWATSGLTETGSLLPGEGMSLAVTVTIPTQPSAPQDVILASDVFTLTATSNVDTGVSASATGMTNASVSPGVSLSAEQSGIGDPGTVLSYTFTLTNNGSYTDSFSLNASGVWPATLPISETGPLPAGGILTITLAVTLPVDLSAVSVGMTSLSAVSELDSQVTAMTHATSEFIVFRSYLPTIRR